MRPMLPSELLKAKAKNRIGLVPVDRMVNRGGKVFKQRFYVRPSKAPAGKPSSGREDPDQQERVKKIAAIQRGRKEVYWL